MSSISISVSIQRVCCSSQHAVKKQTRPAARSLVTKQEPHVITLNKEHQKGCDPLHKKKDVVIVDDGSEKDSNATCPRFVDERWKKGTWDLNEFVKDGKMNWDALISAEVTRRRFLEVYPGSSSNKEPVLFRSSIIPWWAWLVRSYLPQAELLNGRAAMLGFFMAYVVDALTGLGVVGQIGNMLCKVEVFFTVVGLLMFRRIKDFDNLKKLADEATLYDKQWQSSWHNSNDNKA